MSSDITHEDINNLHERMTEQVKETATLNGRMDTAIGTLERVCKTIEGNGQPGLVRNVARMDERIASVESDVTAVRTEVNEKQDTTRWWIGFVIVGIPSAAGLFISIINALG